MRKELHVHYGKNKRNNILISGNELNSAIIKFHISKCKLKRLEENKLKEEAIDKVNDINSEQDKQNTIEEVLTKKEESGVNKANSVNSNNSPIKSSILTNQTEEKTEHEESEFTPTETEANEATAAAASFKVSTGFENHLYWAIYQIQQWFLSPLFLIQGRLIHPSAGCLNQLHCSLHF